MRTAALLPLLYISSTRIVCSFLTTIEHLRLFAVSHEVSQVARKGGTWTGVNVSWAVSAEAPRPDGLLQLLRHLGDQRAPLLSVNLRNVRMHDGILLALCMFGALLNLPSKDIIEAEGPVVYLPGRSRSPHPGPVVDISGGYQCFVFLHGTPHPEP